MSIIKNFGFMWERDKVEWGTQGAANQGQLDGVMAKRRSRKVSFLVQMGVYLLYDRFEAPIHIGQSKNIFNRLKQHRRDHLRNRWAYFSWFGFYKAGAKDLLIETNAQVDTQRTVTLKEGLDELEAIIIQVLEPRLNRRGSNWGEAEEYLQVTKEQDYHSEGDSDEDADEKN